MSERLLKTREVADYLGLSPETVLRRYRAGDVRGIRWASNVLRFRTSDLAAWIEECRKRPGGGRRSVTHPYRLPGPRRRL